MNPFNREEAVTGEWECMECGSIEEGTQARRPAKCSECGAPSSSLEFFSFEDEEFDEDDELEEDDEFEEEDDDNELDDLDDTEWTDDR